MKNTLQAIIAKIESQWLSELSGWVNYEFSNIWLPSHDLSHHLRVWKFAQQLVLEHVRYKSVYEHGFIEALLFACLFHDVGLSVTFDACHGVQSKEIAEKYLKTSQLRFSPYYTEMLEAILFHDDKTYQKSGVNSQKPRLYHFLTVADDLDALGAMGLYRYIEIYLSRGIPIRELKKSIETNARARFAFIKENVKFSPELTECHTARFNRLLQLLNVINEGSLVEINTLIKSKIRFESANSEALDPVSLEVVNFMQEVNYESTI